MKTHKGLVAAYYNRCIGYKPLQSYNVSSYAPTSSDCELLDAIKLLDNHSQSDYNTNNIIIIAAACLIMNLEPSNHITSALRHLHWLPVYYSVQFKLCITMHSSQTRHR